MRRTAALLLLLGACQRQEAAAPAPQGDGVRLEAAARAAGMLADPDAPPVGVFAAGTERVCIVPQGSAYRVGASVDYGAGQRCVARGTASGQADLAVDFGRDCRFDVRFEGDRLVFPAVLPAGCEMWCEGRASFAALAVERLSASAAEATRTVAADEEPLCPAG